MSKSLENAAAHDEQPLPQPRMCLSKYSRRVVLSTILCRSDRGLGLVGEKVVIGGWVKSCKEISQKVEPKPSPSQAAAAAGPPVVEVTCSEVLITRIPFLRSITRLFIEKIPLKAYTVSEKPVTPAVSVPSTAFLRVTDGSCTAHIQVIIESSVHPLSQIMPIGTSILVEGTLKQSQSEKHIIDLVVEKVLHVGIVDQGKYPLKKTRLSSGLLRQNLHLRPRSTTIASITRIRNGLSHATHTFFQNNGFLHVHMPVITSTSKGNACEMFQVTTLLRKSDTKKEKGEKYDTEDFSLETVKAAIEEKSRRIEELKRSDSNREALVFALQDLKKANELAFELEEQQKKNSDASIKMEKLDFSKDYFSCPAYLSMSAGLHLESYACALSSVYTLGPIFQAKKVQSKKQLAEMWMLEANLAFSELEDVMNCSEDYLKFLCNWILENCSDDISFTKKRIDKACVDRIQSVRLSQFKRVTYTEAVETLNKFQDTSFKRSATWGSNLSEEQESYLTDEIYKEPIIIYNHPKSTKPFFLRLNDDQKTVASFDIIIPKVGVLISGGQREERTDIITTRIQEMNLLQDQYEWYLDLRRHGTVKHSGFSVGLEHLVMFVIGTDDARDVIPFPRTPGNANP